MPKTSGFNGYLIIYILISQGTEIFVSGLRAALEKGAVLLSVVVSYSDDCADGDMTTLMNNHGFLSLVPRVAVGWNDVLTTRTCEWKYNRPGLVSYDGWTGRVSGRWSRILDVTSSSRGRVLRPVCIRLYSH